MKDEYDFTDGVRDKYYKKLDVVTCGCKPIGFSEDNAPIISWCALHAAADDMLKELKAFHEMNKTNIGILYSNSIMEKEVVELIARAESK